MSVAYATQWGRMHHGKSDQLLGGKTLARFEGKVDLIFTSPPFPLNRKKRYGNEQGEGAKSTSGGCASSGRSSSRC